MRITFYQKDQLSEPIITSINVAKKLLKLGGGKAWTEHYERDGTLFEITNIDLTGNNSKFKYNKHL